MNTDLAHDELRERRLAQLRTACLALLPKGGELVSMRDLVRHTGNTTTDIAEALKPDFDAGRVGYDLRYGAYFLTPELPEAA
jgi:hypothetical protein